MNEDASGFFEESNPRNIKADFSKNLDVLPTEPKVGLQK
jgi:hypothetical protein